MNSIQRAWRSVVRKPVRSFLLLLVIMTVCFFLLCGMACRTGSIRLQDNTRQAVGAGFQLYSNETNRTKRLEAISDRIGSHMPGYLDEGDLEGVHIRKLESAYGTQWQVYTDNSFESLLLPDIETIAAVPGIADYNITTKITPVNPVNFQRIEDADKDQHFDMGGVSLLGNRKMALDRNVLSENVTIKEGRMVEEQDRDVCVISEQLAAQNHLSIGAKLQFNDHHDPDHSQVYEAQVIGIYQTKQLMKPLMSGDTFRSENIIFTDLRFPEKPEGSMDDPCYEFAYFQVADVDQYNQVKEAVEQIKLDWERYDLIDRNGNLSTMSENFNDLAGISTLLIVITFAAGFVILFLIFTFWTKNRNHEIGVLLSIGYSKGNILLQLFTEALLISFLAFAVAFPLAPASAHMAAEYLVAGQVEQAQLQQEIDANHVQYSSEQAEQTVTGIDVAITNEMLLLCSTAVVVLIGLGVGTAGIGILKKRPKEILSQLS